MPKWSSTTDFVPLIFYLENLVNIIYIIGISGISSYSAVVYKNLSGILPSRIKEYVFQVLNVFEYYVLELHVLELSRFYCFIFLKLTIYSEDINGFNKNLPLGA